MMRAADNLQFFGFLRTGLTFLVFTNIKPPDSVVLITIPLLCCPRLGFMILTLSPSWIFELCSSGAFSSG